MTVARGEMSTEAVEYVSLNANGVRRLFSWETRLLMTEALDHVEAHKAALNATHLGNAMAASLSAQSGPRPAASNASTASMTTTTPVDVHGAMAQRVRTNLNANDARRIFQGKHELQLHPASPERVRILAGQYHLTTKAIRDIWNMRTWAWATAPCWTQVDLHVWLRQQGTCRPCIASSALASLVSTACAECQRKHIKMLYMCSGRKGGRAPRWLAAAAAGGKAGGPKMGTNK